MARDRKTSGRKPKKRILILCEGEQTEPNYFNGIKQFEHKNLRDIALEVEIGKTEKNTPFELVETIVQKQKEQKKRRNSYDELWVVFDKDGHPKMNEAFQAAKRDDVYVIFSSICFEYWILLHFEKTTRAFTNRDQLLDYIESKKYIQNYKKNLADVYNKTRDRIETAIKNSEFLRKQMHSGNVDEKIFKLGAYTNVDDLVKKLLNIEYQYSITDDFKI